jgi:membrane protease YdiL (CAAX protease family)
MEDVMSLALAQTDIAPRSGALRTLGIAVGSGIAVIIAGEGIWTSLIALYSRHPMSFPWFVPAMAAVLAVALVWFKRAGWPVRLNAVRPLPFVLALAAGWSTFFAGAGFYIAYRMQSGLGAEVPMALPPGPKPAIVIGLAMAAVVAGVLEEFAVRGLIQTRLETAWGLVPAILVSGFVWAIFHTNHSYFDTTPLNVAIWFGIFTVVSAMLGTIASRTNSLVPGMVIHAGFDSTYFVPVGLLSSHAPLAFVESLASPHAFQMIGAGLAAIAAISWTAFFRATRRA